MPAISCLESRSREERESEEVRNYYNMDNPYNQLHPNALADGDTKGRGVGTASAAPLPNCNGVIGSIGYYNFITDPDSGAGTSVDVQARKDSMVRSLYTYENPYSALSVNTANNVKDGQYVVS